jgi:two-component system, chemotaxis family, protein-glutamate methylesterase/glutaminase
VSTPRTRVLVCEDSPTFATGLRRALEFDRRFEVVGIHATAEAMIAAIPQARPDVLTVDVELPALGGISAIEEIMSSTPLPILVLSSHVERDGALALSAGALDAIAKGDLDLRDPAGPSAATLRNRLRLLSQVRVIRHPRANLRRDGRRPRPARDIAVVGVVSSTGGPTALSTLLGALPGDFPVPILVVQHMTRGFTAGFVSWLDSVVELPVQLASDGMPLAPGVWIAPEGAHLVAPHALALDRRQAGVHRPSGDVLLKSLAERFGAGTTAVVLSGMGTDGAGGVAAVCAAGGLAFAQDEQTSAIYGMPRAAAERGATALPLEDLGPAIRALVRSAA